MARWWMAAVAGLLLAGGAAKAEAAAEPGHPRARETVKVEAPKDKIWGVVGNFQDMSWLPVVERTEGQGGNKPGATRRLHLKGGAVVEEELEQYDAEHMTYAYKITKVDPKVLPVTDYHSFISVVPADKAPIVEWRSAFEPAAGTSADAATKAVSGLYQMGLEAAKKRIEGGS